MVRHSTRSLSERPQQQGPEQEHDPSSEDGQVDGRTLRGGRYHYRHRHCSRRRLYRISRRRRRSSRRRRRRACRHRRHRRGSPVPLALTAPTPPGRGPGGVGGSPCPGTPQLTVPKPQPHPGPLDCPVTRTLFSKRRQKDQEEEEIQKVLLDLPGPRTPGWKSSHLPRNHLTRPQQSLQAGCPNPEPISS